MWVTSELDGKRKWRRYNQRRRKKSRRMLKEAGAGKKKIFGDLIVCTGVCYSWMNFPRKTRGHYASPQMGHCQTKGKIPPNFSIVSQ